MMQHRKYVLCYLSKTLEPTGSLQIHAKYCYLVIEIEANCPVPCFCTLSQEQKGNFKLTCIDVSGTLGV